MDVSFANAEFKISSFVMKSVCGVQQKHSYFEVYYMEYG